MAKKGIATALLGGLLGGTGLWLAVYPIVKRQIEGSVREQLQTQLPAQLTAQLDGKLAEYNITPQTIQSIVRVVDIFGRLGAAAPMVAAQAAAATGGSTSITGSTAGATVGTGTQGLPYRRQR